MKTYPIYSFLVIAIVAMLTYSCIPCTEGSGNVITEQRLVTEFSGVENTTSFNVDILYDSAYSVEVAADDNILQLISTSVRGGRLIIDTDYDMCISSGSTVNIEIHMPIIESIELNGSGNMDIDDFDCNSLEISNSGSGNIDISNIYSTTTIDIEVDGSGDVKISGKARRGNYDVNGSGSIYAEDLLLDDCYANNTGSGNIYCFAYLLLDATVDGSGDIIFSGSPDEVSEDINGSGSVRENN
jgi:hypothetical protein